jgi:hypothetical protein
MYKFTLATAASVLLACSTASSATTLTQYYDQAGWLQGITTTVNTSVQSVSLENSDWQPGTLTSDASATNLVTSSTTAVPGLTISITSGFTSPDNADPSTLGQFVNGSFVDTISQYGYTIFNFSQAIYGFGGNFDVQDGGGLYFVPSGQCTFSAPGDLNGFFGFNADEGFNQVAISWSNFSSQPGYPATYSLTDLQIVTDPPVDAAATPEPGFTALFALLTGVSALALRRTKRLTR